MEFLNLGWSEILLILLLAFIILGPGQIKKFGGELGAFLRKLGKDGVFREVVQTTDEIRNFPRKIMNEAMLDLDSPVKFHHDAESKMIHSPNDPVDVDSIEDGNPHPENKGLN